MCYLFYAVKCSDGAKIEENIPDDYFVGVSLKTHAHITCNNYLDQSPFQESRARVFDYYNILRHDTVNRNYKQCQT